MISEPISRACRRANLVPLALMLFLSVVEAAAQPLTSTREEIYRRYLEFPSYVKGGKIEPHWMADGSSFWYAEDAPDNTVIWKVDPIPNTRVPLFDTERLRTTLHNELGHDPPYTGVPFSSFTFTDTRESTARFSVESEEFEIRLGTYEINRIQPRPQEEQQRTTPQVVREGFSGYPDLYEIPSPDGNWFVNYKDHNLYLRSSRDDAMISLTADGVEDFDWATWERYPPRWSPDSQKLVITKTDWRSISKLPIIDWLKPTVEVQWKYDLRPGGPVEQTATFVVDIPSRKKVRLNTDREPNQRVHIHAWMPDSSAVFLLTYDRNFKNLQLRAADPSTGESRVILTETTKTALRSLYFRQSLVTLLDSGKQFIWMSEKDGWSHLYLYRLDGTMVRRLTEGSFPVREVVSVDELNGWVYMIASDDRARPFDSHLCRVRLDGSGFARLTQTEGQHEVQLAPSNKFFLDTHSSSNRPTVVELRRENGALLQTLSKANIDVLIDIGWRAPEEFTVKAADGETNIYGVLYKPYDFDAEKRYPVIEVVHEDDVVSRSFVPNYWGTIAQALSQLGFVTFMVDVRGTWGRGEAEFDQVAYRRWSGPDQMADHLAALKQLATVRDFLDLSRVGVFGHSNGGRMAIRAMLLEPDVYHVGVATAPVGEFKDHRQALEGTMDLPENNPEGYEQSSTLRLVDNLKGELLIIQGTSDRGSPFPHTMKLVDALVKAGKRFDLIIIPGGDHGPKVAREYWFGAVARHFQEHLRP